MKLKAKETNFDWNQCLDENSLIVGRCLYNCNGDMDCVADCYDEFAERQKQCPCEVRFETFLSLKILLEIYGMFS